MTRKNPSRPSRLLLLLGVILMIFPLSCPAGERVVIDLKVPLTETADLAPTQLGTTVYLMKSDWATISDIQEDVAVWLKNYERKKNFLGQQVISCTLEVREPSMIRTGNLLNSETITVRYWPGREEESAYQQQFLKDLEAISDDLKEEAYYMGMKVGIALETLLKK